MKKSFKKPINREDTAPMTLSQLADREKDRGCSAAVYSHLADSDEHGRHQKNSRTVGHALIKTDDLGELEALQYAIQQDSDMKASEVREMTQIRKVVSHHHTWFRAKDISGRKYVSRRFATLQTEEMGETPVEIRCFSPYEYDSSEMDEFSDEESVALFREDLSSEQRKYLAKIPQISKRSVIEVDHWSVRQRDEDPTRDGTQNEVMGQSARDAYEDFFNKMKDFLSPKIILILKRAYKANIFSAPENEFRPEWLHKIAHSLMPISNRPEHNPQQKDNLGAAGKWANTEMMLLERLAKWFAVSEARSKITVSSFFNMLLGSELVRHIHFEVRVEIDKRFIRFIQEIDVLKEYPTFRKTSDLAQMVAISDAIFQDRPPIRRERVEVISKRDDTKPNLSAGSISFTHELVDDAFVDVREDELRALQTLTSHPDFAICKRIQDAFPLIEPEEHVSIASIIDLETSGLDPSQHEIIEIAIVSFAYSKSRGIIGIVGTYESLNQPKSAVCPEVTQITGITNLELQGHAIDWRHVETILDKSKYIICHNAKFDGAFLAQQTPEFIQEKVRVIPNQVGSIPFACTLEDINWFARGFDPRKLDYLNFKLGYFYHAHRALSDCWATLNLLRNVPGAFNELLYNAHKKRGYFFSNPLLCYKYDSVPIQSEMFQQEKMANPEQIDQALTIISASSQYKIYRAVPRLPVTSLLVEKEPVITIIDMKTTGSNHFTDEITEISLLSFIMGEDGVVITDAHQSVVTADHPIHWDAVAAILYKTQYLVGHQANRDRKFLESRTPCDIQSRVRVLPYSSTAQDINWRERKVSNTSLKYLSFMFGFFFQPDCVVSQNHATLNLLREVHGAWVELMRSFDKKQTIILVSGPFSYDIRDELKRRGFQWSTGSGGMGKGWWIQIDERQKSELLTWLYGAKDRAEGRNEIYFKPVTALERYSVRAEFKAAEMRIPTQKRAPRKDSDEQDAIERYKRFRPG